MWRGSLDPAAALDLLADAFGSAPAGTREIYPSFQANGQAPARVEVVQRKAEQAYFSIAGFTPGRTSP